MLEFLKRLVGGRADDNEREERGAASDVVGKYFELSDQIQRARAHRNCHDAIAAARQTGPLLRAFVEGCKRDYGEFDMTTSHSVHTAATLMAVIGEPSNPMAQLLE